MKRLIFACLIIILNLSVTAQISLLDEKNGFKTIKLGTSIEKFTNLQKLQDNTYEYYPTNKDLYYVFDTKFDHIVLFFDNNNKLNAILVSKVFQGGSNYLNNAISNSNHILSKFTSLFGPHHESKKMDASWYAKKVALTVGTQYYGVDRAEAQTHVIFGQTTKLSDGF